MEAELVIVGTELLLGQIINTNGAFLSKQLADSGVDVYFETTVGDNKNRLKQVLELASSRSQLVILSGGLGPTTDDLTKEVVSQFLDEELVYDQSALDKMEHLFKASSRKMTENNKKQALTFKNGHTFFNKTGLACGSEITVNEVTYILLPGPPRELEVMMKEEVVPYIVSKMPERRQLTSRYLRFIDIGESQIVTELEELIAKQTDPTIAPYALAGEVMLRLTTQESNDKLKKVLLDDTEKAILDKVGKYYYGTGEELSIVKKSLEMLQMKSKTLSIVDFITDGRVYAAGKSICSESDLISGGMILDNLAQAQKILGAEILTKEDIARSAATLFGTSCSLVISGELPTSIKEPEGIIKLTFFDEGQVTSTKHIIHRDKDYFKEIAVKQSYNMIRKSIL